MSLTTIIKLPDVHWTSRALVGIRLLWASTTAAYPRHRTIAKARVRPLLPPPASSFVLWFPFSSYACLSLRMLALAALV
jgi:hypothetical protein